MPELLLSLLILAAVAWQWRRWLRDAEARGFRAGYTLAEQNAARRQNRQEQDR